MPAPVIADTFRVVFEWESDGGSPIAVNVIHVLSDTLDQDGVAGAIAASVNSGMWQPTDDGYKIPRFSVQPLDGASPQFEYAGGGDDDWEGQGTGGGVPAAAGVVKHLTAAGGRSGRGRTFLPYVAESGMDNGSISSGTVTACNEGWVTFRETLAANDCIFVIASYLHEVAYPVVVSGLEVKLATQKRRNDRSRAR